MSFHNFDSNKTETFKLNRIEWLFFNASINAIASLIDLFVLYFVYKQKFFL